MQILKVLALRGPNVWSRRPVLEAWVDLEELSDSPSNTLPGFNERLMAWLPSMIEHRCSVGERGGFFQRLRDGTWPGHILEHVTLELQSLAGSPVGFGKARETSRPGLYKVVVRYQDEQLARACLDCALELLLAAIYDRPFDVAGNLARLRALADRVGPGPRLRSLIEAADARGIPWRRLEEPGLVQLGQGARQRRLSVAETDAPRPAEAGLDALFPAGETGRIPLACVTGTNGKTCVVRLLAHLLRRGGRTVGMACTEGVFLDGRPLEGGDRSGPRSARQLLGDPRVEAAVLEAGRGGILREGLGFDRCDVAVVTNIGEADHLGQHYVDTPEQMFTVKRSPVDVVLPSGTAVLNAADPLVASMAELSAGSVTFFALDAGQPILAGHRARGGRAAFVRDGRLVLAEGDAERPIAELARVPRTRGGRVGFQVENALAAAAAGQALGLSDETLRAGLESFGLDAADLPGRFERIAAGGPEVVVDDCHNLPALEALVAALDRLAARRRTIVYSAGGGRRDLDLRRQAERLAAAFDRIILYDDPSAGDRAPGAARALLRAALAPGGRAAEVLELPDYRTAIERALALAGPDELVVVQTEDDDALRAGGIVRALAGRRPVPAPGGNAGGSARPRPTTDELHVRRP
jgi:UDP-N-acetylmuramyl tripeptide synthase